MASPVDPLREEDPRRERNAHHEPGIRAAAFLSRLRPGAELRARGRDRRLPRLLVRRRLPPRARLDQARLHLPDQVGVLRQRLRELRFEPAFGRHAVGDRKSTRLNSSHGSISYAVFCLKKKKYLVTRPFLVTDGQLPLTVHPRLIIA